MKKSFAIAALALGLAGCGRAPETHAENNGRSYASVGECTRDNYYAEAICNSGKVVAGEPRFAPEVRAYANPRDCNADGYYSQAACSRIKEMRVFMPQQDQPLVAGPLAATFPVPR